MQCPSCGATANNQETCIDCGHSLDAVSPNNQTGSSITEQTPKKSTLIEFPGVTRSTVPEWRKELSVRVREVQERRAREAAREAARVAAREAAEAERLREEAASRTPQLELLPQAEAPPINPLVAAALKRIERANHTTAEGFQPRVNAATAIAYAPSLEVHDRDEPAPSTAEPLTIATSSLLEAEPLDVKQKNRGLVVVPAVESRIEIKTEKPRAPQRLIVDDPNDPALNYLDSISRSHRVDEGGKKRASAFRRLMCGLLDLITCVLIVLPIGLALSWKGLDLTTPRPLSFLIGFAAVLTFLYFTFSIGLTGRTWAMRVFSLRVIDLRTGLIPTGRQSAGRAFFYLISLAIVGLGILYLLVSREGDTMHDRLTQTAVVKS